MSFTLSNRSKPDFFETLGITALIAKVAVNKSLLDVVVDKHNKLSEEFVNLKSDYEKLKADFETLKKSTSPEQPKDHNEEENKEGVKLNGIIICL